MPIQHAIRKVGPRPEPLTVSKLATEKDLEYRITARPEMISSGWMRIGRHMRTSFGKPDPMSKIVIVTESK